MFLQFIPAIPIIRRFLIISFAFLGILEGMGGVGSVSGQEAGFETGVGWVKNPLMINSGAMVEGALRQMDAGNVTTHTYDVLDHRVRTDFPDGTFITAQYEALNRLVSVNENNIGETTYTYSAVGSLLTTPMAS